MPKQYSEEFGATAVRRSLIIEKHYSREFEAARTIASRVGVSTESLRHRVHQSEVDAGRVSVISSSKRPPQ